MHSTASDGALAPAELMARAAEAGVDLVALTDHDCGDGLDEARGAAARLGMAGVGGGALSALVPGRLMARAAEAGVDLVALTGHDCVDGLDEARDAAARLGMAWVSGVELSAQWQGHTVHVLGYGFDPVAPGLQDALGQVRQGRW